MKALQGFVSLANIGVASPDGGSCTTVRTSREIRVASWPVDSGRTPKGTVIVAQGFGECIEKYYEVVRDLKLRGFSVVTFDWRGQGGSERETSVMTKAHVSDVDDFVEDLLAVVAYCRQQRRLARPLYLLAHSMGAMVALAAARKIADDVERMVLVSPLLEPLRLPLPRELVHAIALLVQGCGFGRAFAPGKREGEPSDFESTRTTSDRKRFDRMSNILMAAPQLVVQRPTFGWVAAILSATSRLTPASASRIAIPTLVVAATKDQVVSTPAIEAYAKGLRAGGCLLIPGAKHEILMERDSLRLLFWAAFDAFVPGTGHSRLDGSLLAGETPAERVAQTRAFEERSSGSEAEGAPETSARRRTGRSVTPPPAEPAQAQTRTTSSSPAADAPSPRRGKKKDKNKGKEAKKAGFLMRRQKDEPVPTQPAAAETSHRETASRRDHETPASREEASTPASSEMAKAFISPDVEDDRDAVRRIAEATKALKSADGSDEAKPAGTSGPAADRLKTRLRAAKGGRRTSRRKTGV